MDKIKENGSLYAVPSTNENSHLTELKELEANMEPVIAKPDKLFREKEISRLYKTAFKVQIERIKQEEQEELERQQALEEKRMAAQDGDKAGLTPKKEGKGKKNMDNIESEY